MLSSKPSISQLCDRTTPTSIADGRSSTVVVGKNNIKPKGSDRFRTSELRKPIDERCPGSEDWSRDVR